MLPIGEAIRAERERRYAANLRGLLVSFGEEQWPAWPAAEDERHHAWVRAHWTILASDRFDAFLEVFADLAAARLRVLGQDLADLGDDLAAIRERLAADEHAVWEEAELVNWRAWIAEHWPGHEVSRLLREYEAALRTLTWKGDHRERQRAREREELARLEELCRYDLSEEELAPLLADRVCGIRGRYRLTGIWNEQRLGITEADIDAP
jgi:hypothetical protein